MCAVALNLVQFVDDAAAVAWVTANVAVVCAAAADGVCETLGNGLTPGCMRCCMCGCCCC